jgi:hypothetical protein
VHPKAEIEKMVEVLEKENACHKRERSGTEYGMELKLAAV